MGFWEIVDFFLDARARKRNTNPTKAEDQFVLGLRYEKGDGVPKDMEKAIYWCTKAAEQGYTNAQDFLGMCFEQGDGVPKDMEKAIYWYTKAAKQGYKDAQTSLNSCLAARK